MTIIQSSAYAEAQELLLQDPTFNQLMIELGIEKMREEFSEDWKASHFSLNQAISSEYRKRGGKVQVKGLGDYLAAAKTRLMRIEKLIAAE